MSWVRLPIALPVTLIMKNVWLVLILIAGGCASTKLETPVIPGYTAVEFRKPQVNELIWLGGDVPIRVTSEIDGQAWIVIPNR